jgi:hypothetical protein
MTPESQLILLTARLKLALSQSITLRELLNSSIDWREVVHRADRHGTLPLVHRHVFGLNAPELLPEFQAALQIRCRQIATKNLLLTHDLLRAFQILKKNDIRVLAFKGPTLALLAYGDLPLRQFNDVDLIVPPEQFEAAIVVVSSLGFQADNDLTMPQRQAYAQKKRQQLLRGPHGGIIELHSGLTSESYRVPVCFEHLWLGRQGVAVHGVTVETFGPEDLLHYLCVHGAKHAWSCLGWVVDIACLVEGSYGIDFPRLWEYSRETGTKRLLSLAFLLCNSLLGTVIPRVVSVSVENDVVARGLALDRMKFLVEPNIKPGIIGNSWFHFRSRDWIIDSVRYLLNTMFATHLSDLRGFSLPREMWFAYWLLRPVRLFVKYSRKFMERRRQRRRR